MDYEDIESLFNNGDEVKKFSHKRWVEIHPVNIHYAKNTNIKYDCRTIDDKLVSYHDGYILLDVTISNNAGANGVSNLDATANFAPKGSHSFVKQTIVRLNNDEIENISDVFLSCEMQNQLEFSHDYSRLAKQYMCMLKIQLQASPAVDTPNGKH